MAIIPSDLLHAGKITLPDKPWKDRKNLLKCVEKIFRYKGDRLCLERYVA
jgi:hypothetical protein